MPIIIQHRILSYLDKSTLIKLSKVNHHLNSLCLEGKFWKSIRIPLRVIFEKTKSCEEHIFRYQSFLQDFTIQYDEMQDRVLVSLYQDYMDYNLRRILELLPRALKSLRIPIYLLRNALLGKSSKLNLWCMYKVRQEF